ncbi:branched-chain amino acid ABC transporter permease [Nocardioides seonyuensis]|uniref:Branched-chain amino acid ABC transporter permease n=1 Tax=Nocardioides seonyuensis TaxID=2518371 RepID=A0A4P7IH38_9ACTN|nr:branched-chain amino acid ABC transporter permease [Nocardioides seonyuensis]QBX56598.1 branched-chain amino acid ABC transporter permease [Nocardioides seonyuensis]
MAAISTGVYFRTYQRELALRHTKAQYVRLALVVVAAIAAPYLLDPYQLSILNTVLIAVVGAVGLNILVGFTGQISLGQGGFLAVGAFTSGLLTMRADLPAPLSIACAVVVTAAAGALFGLPALRLKGLYLAIATLASQEIIVFIARRWSFLREESGAPLSIERLKVGGYEITREYFEFQWYWILLGCAVVAVLAARNLFRTGLGRSFMAVRDQDIAAAAIGVNVTRTKVVAFAVSSGFVGLAGALTAHYSETVTWESFTFEISILYLAMIIVGGLGSVAGAVYGAFFITLLPVFLNEFIGGLGEDVPWLVSRLPAIENAVFGLVIIAFLLIEPRGLDRIWQRMKDYVRFWPFRY